MLYRQIILEWGQDTESGVWGMGYSPDNGEHFYVLNTTHGRKYRAEDGNRLYPYISDQIQDKIDTVVAPAKSAADSAQSTADAAVASAQVTSDAVTAISSATAEAKQGANEAMSRAESAWDVATGAKEAVTDFDPLVKSAQSDASKALTQIADTASALSDAKTQFGSDVAAAKELANTAQTTANSAVESAGENARALASQANALSDAKKAMDSDVASAKGLANTAQATADNAIKSASSVANDLAAVASQAKANASGITKVTSDVGLLQTTVADNSGNISKIQETAKQIQQAVSDNAGNITTAKQTADSAVAVASDAKSNATVAVQTASGASVTAKNAQGDATTAMVTAKGAVTQASDANSNATIAVQTASEASVTATNAQGDASIAKQTASDASVQIKNAQGDISKLQTRAGTIETSVANNSGAIADVQATANQLKASVSDNSGNITVAKQTADSAVAVASDARSNATVANQTASQASITAQNASGQAASAVITANGAMTTASDAKSNATVAVQTASGASLTAINANSDATVAKQTASEAKVQASNAESDFAQLSIRANKIEANVATNSGAIASVQQTASGLTTSVSSISDQLKASGHKVKVQSSTFNTSANYSDAGVWLDGTKVGSIGGGISFTMGTLNLDWSGYTQKDYATTSSLVSDLLALQDKIVVIYMADAIPSYGSDLVNALAKMGGDSKLATATSVSYRRSPFIFIGMSLDTNGKQVLQEGEGYLNTGTVGDGQVKYAWGYEGDSNKILTSSTIGKVTEIKTTVDGINTTINDPKTGLNATYQTAQGNASTISNVKGDVTQLQTTANGLTSRVGNLESKSATQQTEFDQTKAAILQLAKQTDVDTLKGNVTDLQAKSTTQASEIKTKVTRSDVTGMLTDYATQEYTQSLVTQTANNWNLNLTKLQTDVNAIKTNGGGVNLLTGTAKWEFPLYNNGGTQTVQKYDDETNYIQHTSNTPIDNMGPWFVLAPEVGQVYTLSADVCGNGYITGGYLYYEGGDEGSLGRVDLTNNWQRISNTFRVNTIHGNWIIYANNSTLLKVKNIMVEKGTVAHDWSPAPSDMATVTSVTNLSATVDGIKGTVATKADQSTVTQLSNVVQSKVSSGDFTSTTTQLKNLINQRVQVGDVISQINQEAGGDTLIQVSNGKKSLILDAENTIITGEAWIPSAAISSISADKIMLGSSALYNSDGTLNLVNTKDGTTSKIIATQGNVDFDGTEKNASVIHFASDNNTNAFTITPVGATVTPTLFFERFDQTPGHWLGFTRNETEHEGVMFHTWDDDGERFFVDCHARFNKNLRTIGTLSQGSWNGTTAKPEAGILTIKSGNTIWSGSDFLAVGSNVTGTYTGVWAKAFVQQSTLSAKTNIETVDPKYALDLVNKTDIRSYQYKSDVAQGYNKRYTSLIIDDVNDVSKYYAPNEFTNEERTGRDDGSAVGYLFLAVKELTKRIENLEEKLNE